MNLTNFYTNTFGTTELWGLNLGFYFTMLALGNSNPDITRLYLNNCGDK